ncbi:MAG TPA: hypothetical protein VNW53_17325 [Phenylobacterium sp.]|jgi:hypothetical protein|uniref:hypothetical protein n=1 Tax=Phenylobacterium sp. TaxID=1871053 RepID=UPI002BAEABBB|nr:hypothetical protein [Phenylobacterium sp.]HXA40764.1 hypothetical protein [Phenylobacterium sp.]
MPITFNALLRDAEIDPKGVRLVRHQDSRADADRTPYALWRDHSADFVTYQSRQSPRSARSLSAPFWAVFVVTPGKETLFAGLYDVGEAQPGEIGLPAVHIRNAVEGEEYVAFDLALSERLGEYIGKLVIDWGPGFLAWVQQAEKQNKPVLELRSKFQEPEFPGYLKFIKPLSEIEALPVAWKTALSAVKGVYVLTCPNTKLLYVGSATGQGGFYERWVQHARTGGDALQLRIREPSDYQVSILEVAASGALPDDIVRLEHLWMRKLQTVEMGLNSGTTRPSPRTD